MARARRLDRLARRHRWLVDRLLEVVREVAHEERVRHDHRRRGADARRGHHLAAALQRDPDVDEAVAGVVEISAAHGDVVVEPGRGGRLDREERRRHGLVRGGIALAAEPGPALAGVVDGAFPGHHGVGLVEPRPVDEPLRGREPEPELGMVRARLHEARRAEGDEAVLRHEVRAMPAQLVHAMPAEPPRVGLDDVALLAGAAEDLAVGDAHAPLDLRAAEPRGREELAGQRAQLAGGGDGEGLEEGGNRADAAILVPERDRRARVLAGDLAGRLVDAQGRGADDAPVAERALRVVLEHVVVDGLRRRAEPADREGREDAQFGDLLGCAPLLVAMTWSTQASDCLSMSARTAA